MDVKVFSIGTLGTSFPSPATSQVYVHMHPHPVVGMPFILYIYFLSPKQIVIFYFCMFKPFICCIILLLMRGFTLHMVIPILDKNGKKLPNQSIFQVDNCLNSI